MLNNLNPLVYFRTIPYQNQPFIELRKVTMMTFSKNI
jgi:hypothetical protein